MTARKKPAGCHTEKSFAIVSKAVHDVTTRLMEAEARVAELDAVVIGLSREVERLKQPWWRRFV